MTTRTNPCLRKDGTPKSAFQSREKAQRWIENNAEGGGETTALLPYECAEHGWHIGGRAKPARSHRRGSKGAW